MSPAGILVFGKYLASALSCQGEARILQTPRGVQSQAVRVRQAVSYALPAHGPAQEHWWVSKACGDSCGDNLWVEQIRESGVQRINKKCEGKGVLQKKARQTVPPNFS